MAIFLENRTICSLCSKIIYSTEEVIAFPPFIENKADELDFINDNVFHKKCIELHPKNILIQERYKIYLKSIGHFNKCAACNGQINSLEDYFPLGFFTYNPNDLLFNLNYMVCHISCLKNLFSSNVILEELISCQNTSIVSSTKVLNLLNIIGKKHREVFK